MIVFDKPDYKIKEYDKDKFYGKFVLEPLERGFGLTLGNALRRVMLSSLPGTAVTTVRIEGVLHEFQTIDGVIEDVTTILLNLKKIVFKNHSEEEKTVRVKANKEGEILAGMIEHDADIEIINPDALIATLAKGGHLDMEITLSNGRGYIRAEENKQIRGIKTVGEIPTDSNYSPIERVSYDVEKTRVGQDESYDRLILNVWTNGAMLPEQAVAMASKILMDHLEILTNLEGLQGLPSVVKEKEENNKQKTLETAIEYLDLTVRAYNCLKKAEINTLQDLVEMSKTELSAIRNLGKKSYKEVLDKLEELGLELREEE